VYTVSQESRYLLIQGIPALGVYGDLVKEFALYGAIGEYRLLDEYPAEEFTEVMWIIKFSQPGIAEICHSLHVLSSYLQSFFPPSPLHTMSQKCTKFES